MHIVYVTSYQPLVVRTYLAVVSDPVFAETALEEQIKRLDPSLSQAQVNRLLERKKMRPMPKSKTCRGHAWIEAIDYPAQVG